MQNIKIGISACLLGETVRYDGQHKLDRYLRDTLGRFVEFIPVCPEVECGLGVPREAMRLVGDIDRPRLLTINSKQDFTERMESWSERRLDELSSLGLCGFIFKSKSPSSGMERVKVYPDNGGPPSKQGVGVFARLFQARFPLLPVEDEGRLHDLALRENFIERIFVMRRWRETVAAAPTARNLVDFHTRHKLLIMSHSPDKMRELGRLTAKAGDGNVTDLCEQYLHILMPALKLLSTARKNTDVLQHAMGHLKKHLTSDEKEELLELLTAYRDTLVPLIVPVTLLRHYLRKYNISYLQDQYFFNPHPLELQLRNHC
jgi:uncharacterized protein YbgA (DUF1722 family)/uncharacterized protein YbbK (DUF523 family)